MGPQANPEVVEGLPPKPPDIEHSISPRSINLELNRDEELRGSPLITVNSVLTGVPLEFEDPQIVYATCENTGAFPHFNRCAKPLWPKSPATIPSSYFRDFNRKVNLTLTYDIS